MKRLAIILALMLLCPVLDYAQDNTVYTAAPVEISEIRTKIGDNWFYVHKVLPKQTLYSICRAYDITQQEVYEANRAALETGLKAGMELLIPVHGDAQPEVAAAQPQSVEQPQVQTPPEPAAAPQPADGYTIHRVKWYESLYSIARKYEITPESIIRANSLTRTDLQTGQMLKIPASSYQDAVERQVNDDFAEQTDGAGDDVPVVIIDDDDEQFAQDDSGNIDEDDDDDEDGFFLFRDRFSGTARIALLLPFNARSSSPSRRSTGRPTPIISTASGK